MASTAAEDINMTEENKLTEASSSRMHMQGSQATNRDRYNSAEVDDPLRSASASASGSEAEEDREQDDELHQEAPVRMDSDEEMDVQALGLPVKRERGQDKPRAQRGVQYPGTAGRKGHGERLLHSDIIDKFRHEVGDIFLKESFTPLGSSNGSSAQPVQAASASQTAAPPS